MSEKEFVHADPVVVASVAFARDQDIPGVKEHVDYLAEILSDQRELMRGEGSEVSGD